MIRVRRIISRDSLRQMVLTTLEFARLTGLPTPDTSIESDVAYGLVEEISERVVPHSSQIPELVAGHVHEHLLRATAPDQWDRWHQHREAFRQI